MKPGRGFIFDGSIGRILDYAYFCVIEFGAVAAFLATRFWRDRLFVLTVMVLLFIPFYKKGPCNDFCMRVSIPVLVIFSVYSIQYIQRQRQKVLVLLFIILLSIGAMTPVFEIGRSVDRFIKGGGLIADNAKTLVAATGIRRYYLSKNIANNFFYKFLAKHSG